MSDLTPITREEALLDGADLEPITRKEQFIKRIYDKTQEIPDPITREECFLKKAGEGTSPVTIEQLNATENGTYSEPGKAYSPVIVEVPEPTLITKSITANGTYSASDDNADGYSQVTVAVDGFKKKSIANTPTDIASFNDGTANPMPSLEISIVPVQSGSGDPSPSNVRPISGWSGAEISVIGKNLTYLEQGSIDITNGNEISVITRVRTAFITVEYNKFYVASSENNGWVIKNGVGYDANKKFISYGVFPSVADGKIRITNPNIKYVRFIYAHGDASETATPSDFWYQFENGETVTEYSPYQGSTTSIPFHDSSDNPITVYGGRLNVTSGELTVTHANIASYNGETINEPWISSMDVYSAGATPTTGAQVVYPLATPQTYQLTPAQVSTLLGQNNIFADCGQILEGEYFVTL